MHLLRKQAQSKKFRAKRAKLKVARGLYIVRDCQNREYQEACNIISILSQPSLTTILKTSLGFTLSLDISSQDEHPKIPA